MSYGNGPKANWGKNWKTNEQFYTSRLIVLMNWTILINWTILHYPSLRGGLKKVPRLCERLISLGIMGAQLRASLKPFNTMVLCYSRGFRGTLPLDPIIPRDVSLYA